MVELQLYNRYLIQFHLLTKLVAYCSMGCSISIVDFKHTSVHYSGNKRSVRSKSKLFIVHLLYSFFLEKVICANVHPLFIYKSISSFKIVAGQLSGFSSYIQDAFLLYNFLSQYLLNNVLSEKGFSGLIVGPASTSDVNFGFINLSIRNIYVFPEVMSYFEQINELLPDFQMYFNVNVSITSANLWGVLLLFTHMQIPLCTDVYYDYI